MFDAVIFDCDGCLVDSEVLVAEVEFDRLAGIGLNYERDDYFARFTGLSMVAFYETIAAESMARLGRPLPETFAAECQAAVREAVRTRLQMVPGALEAVLAVRIPKAVASSSTAVALRNKLSRTGLHVPFDPHIYSADHVARAKPAPDLFLHAARALGIDPARCLAIEDSSNGVTAARAAGMTVWGFTGGGHATPGTPARLQAAGASRVVANWGEAKMLFAEIPTGS